MWLDRESVKVARKGAAEAGGAVWARIWVPPEVRTALEGHMAQA